MDMLEVNGLTKKFGGLVAVNNCSFNIAEKTILGLIGPNGSGKTTILKLITGFLDADAGDILFKGKRINHLKPHQIAREGIGMTFQIARMFKDMSVLRNMLVATPPNLNLSQSSERALELLKFVNLYDLRNEYAGKLSYGQQKLLEFARLLMLDFELILLDEPVAGILPALADKMIDYIRQLRDQGKTFVIVEHNIRVLSQLCERMIVLDKGQKIAEGTPKEVQLDEGVRKAYFLA